MYKILIISKKCLTIAREIVHLRHLLVQERLLTIQWQLLCQAIVSLVYKWEGLLKIV